MNQEVNAKNSIRRLRVVIHGAVQGVGFRPFIYRLAASLGLTGWVINSTRGVVIEAEGEMSRLNAFLLSIEKDKPSVSFIQSLESSVLDPLGYTVFEVKPSDASGDKTVLILPDIATCPDCLAEIFNPLDRRYQYPFTNCTNCGPRFSIIQKIPYDRINTTMAGFAMCDQCLSEYNDPANRRFHAQPNACPVCGPRLALWDADGAVLGMDQDALVKAARFIREGFIVSVKGIGGFHLMADARNEEAIRRLRRRKHREGKPLALMYPSLEAIRADCIVTDLEQRLLRSPQAPIVLIRRHPGASSPGLANSVAPGNPYLGVMLPYSPLHHLLMAELHFPVIATSGNLSEEPICIDEQDALVRLKNIADVFLVHNRPIARHLDDSIACMVMGREMLIRRARGYAPLPVHVKHPVTSSIAVGAHLKNAVAMPVADRVFVSQHIGDLETLKAYEAFERVIADFQHLYNLSPEKAACDLHPSYFSTRYAHCLNIPVVQIQHHFAHVLSCLADNHLEPPVLGVAWDGTGYGPDGSIWGGEFLKVADGDFNRAAYLRTFLLPGGDKAIKEPRRAAIGLLYEIFGEKLRALDHLNPIKAFSSEELSILLQMLGKKLNTFTTSSAGRLFDAVASILNVEQYNQFEGKAAMSLEFLADSAATDDCYPIRIIRPNIGNGSSEKKAGSPPYIIDWEPMMRNIIGDVSRHIPSATISAMFHNSLAEAIVMTAEKIGENKILLTGGCFQNRYLTEKTIIRLQKKGFQPYFHQRIPPNDGGIALGQAIGASLAKPPTPSTSSPYEGSCC